MFSVAQSRIGSACGERARPEAPEHDRDSVPIWARPQPGSRRPRYRRDQIAAEALEIADADGIDAVSMRRVAAELDAGTMTLYHYVRTKDELITQCAALHLEQSLAAVADLKIATEQQLELISLVDDFTFGYLLRPANPERRGQCSDHGRNQLHRPADPGRPLPPHQQTDRRTRAAPPPPESWSKRRRPRLRASARSRSRARAAPPRPPQPLLAARDNPAMR